jgi:protein tyrosine phosphatase
MEGRAPKCRREFIDLVCKVQKAISNNENSRIAVHANGGGSNCSVFCALTILLNQFRNDQRVDVCRTVKTLKTQRPNMIETYEQYEFLYECLLDFIEMFGIYNNNQSTVSLNSSFNDSLYRKSPLKHI